MSLTAELKKKESRVTRFLVDTIPNHKILGPQIRERLRSAETLRLKDKTSFQIYGLLGTAIDYRLRYYFEVTRPSSLAAYHGAELYAAAIDYDVSNCFFKRFVPALQKTVREAKDLRVRRAPNAERRLNRFCVVLAYFEQMYRMSSYAKESPIFKCDSTDFNDWLELAEAEWINDLCEMSWLFHDRCSEWFAKKVKLNPTFEGSRDIGGADADIIVAKTLIEFKTTIRTDCSDLRYWLNQLLGYVLLDYGNHYRLTDVGLYFPRQGQYVGWPLTELFDILSEGNVLPLKDLREQFRQIVVKKRS